MYVSSLPNPGLTARTLKPIVIAGLSGHRVHNSGIANQADDRPKERLSEFAWLIGAIFLRVKNSRTFQSMDVWEVYITLI